MRTRTCLALALAAGLASRAAAGEAPPKVLLHLPFDGSADAAFCVTGRRKTSYVEMAYGPGKKGQAANIGSERYPCGLVVRGRDLFDKQAGSFAVWYKPLWNPEEDREHAATRTLVTDGKPALGVGHFWITLAGKAVHFAWRGRQARGVSAPIARWRKGTWHHIVATWDSAEGIALYIDGERGARRQMRWQLPPSDTLYIGANRRGLNRAEGLLDELYLYDRALSAAEVERAYVQNLPTARPSIRRPQPPPPAREPRLTLHLPFDGSPTAKTAGGKAEPETAEGAEFTNGLRGKALVCSEGLDLAYAFEKNVSKAAGAVTFWARSSFVASAPRGILLADEQPAASEEEQRANTLGLWLQRADLARVEDKVVARPRIPTLHFDMLPQRLQRPLFRWSKADWYHVAVCWRQGREVALYVNGELAARRAARSLTWSESPSRLLHVGSWGGKMPADAVIDELKVYDAPLAADQIRQDAARFLLPLSLKLRHTLFLRGQPADLVIDAVNISPQPFEGEVTVQVANPGGQAIASVTEALQVEPKASAPIALKLDAKALAHEGLYPISTSSPKRVNTPVAYFLVVPERAPAEPVVEPQPERKLLETIELGTLEEGAARLVHSGRSTIQEAAGAQCRQAGPRRDDRFAVRFTVKEPGEPHVVVVTYPDDRPRSAEIVINSESFPHTLDVATGYFTTEGGTDKLLELPLYFWPRERDHALIVRTLGTGRPAACATIAVHQLQGGLPPTRTQTPADGGRPVGLWWRKPSVPLQFGARQLLAPDVYASFGRLADYAAFAGQNLIGYPLAWNTGTLYPSPGESFRQGSGGDRHCSDWVQYALHHCEGRGVRFLPELFLGDTMALSDTFGSHTEEDLAAGTPSARMVLWDGSLSRGGTQEPPLYTPAHPAVREAVLQRIDEIAARYGESSALEGIALHLGQSQFPWFGSLQCGYGDATVARFEEAANIQVPAAKTGSARFAQRARWLLRNRREAWVAWRCRIVHALLTEAAARLAKRRPGLSLYLNVAAPDPMAWNPLFNLSTVAADTRSIDQLYREAGLDLSLYAKVPNLVVRRVFRPTDPLAALHQGGAAGVPASAVRDHERRSEASAPFRPVPRLAAVGAYRPFRSSIGAARPMEGFWWRPPRVRNSYPTPSGRRFLEPFARAVAELDARSIAFGDGAPLSAGHEEAVRTFARAYRALPRKAFEDVRGMADPVCVRELRDADAHYVYLVSRVAFPVDAYLVLQPSRVTVRDFAQAQEVRLSAIADRRLPAGMPEGFVSEHALPAERGPVPDPKATKAVSGALLHVTLAPFELRSYRILTPDARIMHAASQAPLAQRLRLAQRVESARSLIKQSKAPPAVLDPAHRTLALIERAWAKRELARLEHLLDSYPVERLR